MKAAIIGEIDNEDQFLVLLKHEEPGKEGIVIKLFDVKSPEKSLSRLRFHEEDLIRALRELDLEGIKVDEKKRELLSKSVDILELSVRSYNCLKTAKIETLGQLIKKSASDLLRERDFGRNSLAEIQDELAKVGLSLRKG